MYDRLQRRLFILAGLFFVLYALALTLAPAARGRDELLLGLVRWDHWLGVLIWLIAFRAVHLQSIHWLPGRDPFLLPVVGLLSGWGMLTIWRLQPAFGLRQALWLGLCAAVLIAGMRLDAGLGFLRRYKYLWLTGSLALTALTLVMGVNPMGYGPRMWLGCCGVYLQPSEPLKLLLIAYLAAYLAERRPAGINGRYDIARYLAPTFIMAGLALVLLVIQRDLGAASILFFLYAAMIYIASGRIQVVITAIIGILVAGGLGYVLFDVVRVRVDAWLNPWLDPSGRSFQIVQALLAVANGGLFGRGPGMGNPGLVPVAHSDLIFAAVAEEQGLIGSLGLLLLYALLTARGLRAALAAPDNYHRCLASGLSTYFAWQGLLIIGGSLRLLPLTGVTLPFFSYGGSSLLVSFIALLLLLQISASALPTSGERAKSGLAQPVTTAPAATALFGYNHLAGFLLTGFAAAGLVTGWWAAVRGPDLLTRTDNPRRAIADRSVRRGALLDRQNNPINISLGAPGDYLRTITYPDLSNVVGYTNPTYGQAGIEASLDGYLRGILGNSGLNIWWQHILYGQPPPGLDVRLSLDLNLQRQADILLRGQTGALALLDARSGEILVMASHPTFNANRLEQQWDQLVADPAAPLLNRAALGQYPPGDWQQGGFAAAFEGVKALSPPEIYLPDLPVAASLAQSKGFSPLQAALVAAAITADGVQPAPLLVLAVDLPQSGWVMLPALGTPRQVISRSAGQRIIASAALPNLGIWQGMWSVALPDGAGVTWYIAGVLPGAAGKPFVLAVLLEQTNIPLAESIGQAMMARALRP